MLFPDALGHSPGNSAPLLLLSPCRLASLTLRRTGGNDFSFKNRKTHMRFLLRHKEIPKFGQAAKGNFTTPQDVLLGILSLYSYSVLVERFL